MESIALVAMIGASSVASLAFLASFMGWFEGPKSGEPSFRGGSSTSLPQASPEKSDGSPSQIAPASNPASSAQPEPSILYEEAPAPEPVAEGPPAEPKEEAIETQTAVTEAIPMQQPTKELIITAVEEPPRPVPEVQGNSSEMKQWSQAEQPALLSLSESSTAETPHTGPKVRRKGRSGGSRTTKARSRHRSKVVGSEIAEGTVAESH